MVRGMEHRETRYNSPSLVQWVVGMLLLLGILGGTFYLLNKPMAPTPEDTMGNAPGEHIGRSGEGTWTSGSDETIEEGVTPGTLEDQPAGGEPSDWRE
jgi:hypothetical protein